MPCPVHEAGEGAASVSVCGRGGEGACARGACPAWRPEAGTGRWAPREACEGQGTPPSDTGDRDTRTLSVLFQFFLFS